MLEVRLAQQLLQRQVDVARPLQAKMMAVSQSTEVHRLDEPRMFDSPSEPYSGVNPRRPHYRTGEATPLLQHDARLLGVDGDWSGLSAA